MNLSDTGLKDIGELLAAARLLQNACEQTFAAEAEVLRFDERILLLKSLSQSGGVRGADARVDHQLGFFLCTFDQCATSVASGPKRRRHAQAEQKTTGRQEFMRVHRKFSFLVRLGSNAGQKAQPSCHQEFFPLPPATILWFRARA